MHAVHVCFRAGAAGSSNVSGTHLIDTDECMHEIEASGEKHLFI